MPFKLRGKRMIEVKPKTVWGLLVEVGCISVLPVSDKDYRVMSKRRVQLIMKEYKRGISEKERYELDRLQFTFYEAFIDRNPRLRYKSSRRKRR